MAEHMWNDLTPEEWAQAATLREHFARTNAHVDPAHVPEGHYLVALTPETLLAVYERFTDGDGAARRYTDTITRLMAAPQPPTQAEAIHCAGLEMTLRTRITLLLDRVYARDAPDYGLMATVSAAEALLDWHEAIARKRQVPLKERGAMALLCAMQWAKATGEVCVLCGARHLDPDHWQCAARGTPRRQDEKGAGA